MELSGQFHALPALLPGKSSRYPLDRRLGGHQSLSGQREEETILDPTDQEAVLFLIPLLDKAHRRILVHRSG
jgi:hypothetical protein